jgi:hypothetical protein
MAQAPSEALSEAALPLITGRRQFLSKKKEKKKKKSGNLKSSKSSPLENSSELKSSLDICSTS